MEKIQYLCSRISAVEWSGILMYSVREGSIKDPNSLKIDIEDIIPMNKGTLAYTTYQYNRKNYKDPSKNDDKHIDYVMKMSEKNPSVMTWNIGHIHSHHSMLSYFSSTDIKELRDNSKHHNFYLSIVVNNRLDIVGKVAVYAEVKQEVKGVFKAKDEKGKDYVVTNKNIIIQEDFTTMYDCEIIKEDIVVRVDPWFVESVESIIKDADSETTDRYLHRSNYDWRNQYEGMRNIPPNSPENLVNHTSKRNQWIQDAPIIPKEQRLTDQRVQERIEEPCDLDSFIQYCLTKGRYTGRRPKAFISLLDLLQNSSQVNPTDFVLHYPDRFTEYFMDDEEVEDTGYFHMITELVIERLEELELDYPILTPIVVALSKFLTQLENQLDAEFNG